MQIEAGKKYINRLGEVSGVMEATGNPSLQRLVFRDPENKRSFTNEGRYFVGSGDCEYDLVEEWMTPVTMNNASHSVKSFSIRLTEQNQGWADFAEIGYEPLVAVLQEAHDQAASGKGRDRHANGRAFIDQPIMEIGRMCGAGFNAGQSIKKQQEAMGMLKRGEADAAIRELLGAINYAASAILPIREA